MSNIEQQLIQQGLNQEKTMEMLEIVNEIKEAIKCATSLKPKRLGRGPSAALAELSRALRCTCAPCCFLSRHCASRPAPKLVGVAAWRIGSSFFDWCKSRREREATVTGLLACSRRC